MTNAVPFGIYLAPKGVIRADARPHASNDEWCYIQLLNRVSGQSYAIYVAASSTDLLRLHNDGVSEALEDKVVVSTITRQNLHTHCRLLTAPCAQSPLYAAPSCILKDKYSDDGEDLQLVASCAWLCYFRVLQVYAEGYIQVRVAALPHRVDSAGRSFIVILGHDEFAQALRLERSDLALATCDLRDRVEQRATSISRCPVEHIRPAISLAEEEEDQNKPTRQTYPPEVRNMLRVVDLSLCVKRSNQGAEREEQLPKATVPPTEKLAPVFVPAAVAQQATQRFVQRVGKAPRSRRQRQKMWLQAALLALQFYQEQARQQNVKETIKQQDHRIRLVLVNWLSSAVQLVKVEAVNKEGQFAGKKDTASGYIVRVESPVVA